MPQALRSQHANGAKRHGQHAAANEPLAAKQRGLTGLGAKQQRPQPQHAVHAHLGHERKQRTHGRRGRAVGRHQPEVERPHGGLDEERHRQNGSGCVQQPPVCHGHARNALCQVGHVERAGDAVEHRHPDEEQRRRREVDGDVVQPRRHARAARAVQQQPIGRSQHDLEEHEQVEQVGREKRPGQPHELELEQRVKVHARPVPARGREQHRGQRHRAGQHQHHGRQAVDDQHDAERRRPVARQVHAQAGLHAGLLGLHQQQHGHHQAHQGRGDVERDLGALAFLAQQQHEPGGEQGQRNGREDQVWHQPVK